MDHVGVFFLEESFLSVSLIIFFRWISIHLRASFAHLLLQLVLTKSKHKISFLPFYVSKALTLSAIEALSATNVGSLPNKIGFMSFIIFAKFGKDLISGKRPMIYQIFRKLSQTNSFRFFIKNRVLSRSLQPDIAFFENAHIDVVLI